MLSTALLLSAISALEPQAADAAGPWYVASTGDDTNDCLAPATPCLTIIAALTKLGFAPGDTVRVAAGTYTGTGEEVVHLDTDATLSGGWDPTFTDQTATSVLDGEDARRGITVQPAVDATVERFIVENGLAFGFGGAGILNQGTLTLDDCVVRNNNGGFGIGIRNLRAALTLNRTAVTRNPLENSDGTVVLRESAVTHNDGSGILNGFESASLTLHLTTVSDNMGFGIENDVGTVTVQDSSVESNSGGIFNFTGSVSVASSTIRDNARFNFGGLQNLSGNGRIGRLALTNSTVTGNRGTESFARGGGIFNSGALTIVNTTITDNTAEGGGGGIFHQFNPGFSGAILSNSIIAGNSAGVFAGPDCQTDFTSQIVSEGHNLIGSLQDCSVALAAGDLTNLLPGVGPLQSNGGPTATHALLLGSPAIEMGDDGVCSGAEVNRVDQRGVNRPTPPAGTCDIGAVEFADCDGSGVDDGTEIADGTLIDADGNLVPDVCETLIVLPFDAFVPKLKIDDDEFEVKARFRLGAASDGIDPLSEDVTLEIGRLSTTIPAGSFARRKHGHGPFTFEGIIDGVEVFAVVRRLGGGWFRFVADVEDADLAGTANPVTVRLTIGDDEGSVTVTGRRD